MHRIGGGCIKTFAVPARIMVEPARASRDGEAQRRWTDEELLGRIAAGDDEEAFELLYRRHARPVYSLVARIVGSPTTGEDVAQEAFMAVWRASATYRPERGAVRWWMFTIARNAAVDAVRRHRDALVPAVPEHAEDGGLDERVAAAELAYRVHAAVDSLPEPQRSVIELTYWQHLSQSQAAAVLGIPVGTVKTRARSALASLAASLADEEV